MEVLTQHSTNLVPLIVMDKDQTWNLKPGKLGDVAPSILKSNGRRNSRNYDRRSLVS